MKSNRKSYLKLGLLLLFFIFYWLIVNLLFHNAALFWLLLLAGMALTVIAKGYRKLSKRDWITAIILGFLAVFSNPIFAALTVLTYLASSLLLKENEKFRTLLKLDSLKQAALALVSGLLVGFVLGFFNLVLAHKPMSLPGSFPVQAVLNALRAGVFEEVAFRLFFFAIIIYLTKKNTFSKMENMLVYGILTLPHTLIHFGLEKFDIGSVVILSLVFGLPFAFLLRKQGLYSAITAHTVVDLLRFVFLEI